MAIIVGIVMALAVGISASFLGVDRDRAFYPTVMAVIASYYGLFAIMAGSMPALAAESVVIAGFLALSAAGFKRTLWLVAGALLAHGVFDLVHGRIIANPGVPEWWAGFCLAYDGTAAGYLAWRLLRQRVDARGSGAFH